MNHTIRDRALPVLSLLLFLAAGLLCRAGGGGLLSALALVLCAVGGGVLAVSILSRQKAGGEDLPEQVTSAARAGLDRLREHNEEVRMLRHDMKKHFYALRQLAEGGAPRLVRYLDDLIQADEAIPPVVHSGGALLSAILNGALSRAAAQGTAVKILRDQAPEELPLSDRDLCSLVLNVMENALEATAAPGLEEPFLQLDLYTKGEFFFFSCENSRSAGTVPRRTGPEGNRGLGLKIVRRIAEAGGGLVQIDEEPNRYRISIALPIGREGSS